MKNPNSQFFKRVITETASQIPAVRLYMGHIVTGIQSKALRSVEKQ